MTTYTKNVRDVKKGISKLPMAVSHTVIINRRIYIHDGTDSKDTALKGRPYILALGQGKYQTGNLDEHSSIILEDLPKADDWYVACLVREELPAKFEQLAKTSDNLHWSRIFSVRTVKVPKSITGGEKFNVTPSDMDLMSFVRLADEKKLKKSDHSALSFSATKIAARERSKEAKRKKKDYGKPEELYEWLRLAAAFAHHWAKKSSTTFVADQFSNLPNIVGKGLDCENDCRLAMALGKLLGKTTDPNVIYAASRYLPLAIARSINTQKRKLIAASKKPAAASKKPAAASKKPAASLPKPMVCLYAGLLMANRAVEKKTGYSSDQYLSQLFVSYALSLSHQMLITAAAGLYDRSRKQTTKPTLESCYRIATRFYVFDPVQSKQAKHEIFKNRPTKPGRAATRPSVKDGYAAYHGIYYALQAVDDDKSATQSGAKQIGRWDPSVSEGPNLPPTIAPQLPAWVVRGFANLLHGDEMIPIPIGVRALPQKRLRILHLNSEASVAGFGSKFAGMQSSYVFRSARALIALLGKAAFKKGALLKADADQWMNLCKIAHSEIIHQNQNLLSDLPLLQKKLIRDVARRRLLLASYSEIASDLKNCIEKSIAEGPKVINALTAPIEKAVNQLLISLLHAPQVQGLVGAMPLSRKRAWRTRALLPKEAGSLMGRLPLGLFYVQRYIQPHVWNFGGANRKYAPMPMWIDTLDHMEKEPQGAGAGIGHKLTLWLEFAPVFSQYTGRRFQTRTTASFRDFFNPGRSSAIVARAFRNLDRALERMESRIPRSSGDRLTEPGFLAYTQLIKSLGLKAKEIRKLPVGQRKSFVKALQQPVPYAPRVGGIDAPAIERLNWIALNRKLKSSPAIYVEELAIGHSKLAMLQRNWLVQREKHTPGKSDLQIVLLALSADFETAAASNFVLFKTMSDVGIKGLAMFGKYRRLVRVIEFVAEVAKVVVDLCCSSFVDGLKALSTRMSTTGARISSVVGATWRWMGRFGTLLSFALWIDDVSLPNPLWLKILSTVSLATGLMSTACYAIAANLGMFGFAFSWLGGLTLFISAIATLTILIVQWLKPASATQAEALGYKKVGGRWTSPDLIPEFTFSWHTPDSLTWHKKQGGTRGSHRDARYEMVVFSPGGPENLDISISEKRGMGSDPTHNSERIRRSSPGIYYVRSGTLRQVERKLKERYPIETFRYWGGSDLYVSVGDHHFPTQRVRFDRNSGGIEEAAISPILDIIRADKLPQVFRSQAMKSYRQRKSIPKGMDKVEYLFIVQCAHPGPVIFKFGQTYTSLSHTIGRPYYNSACETTFTAQALTMGSANVFCFTDQLFLKARKELCANKQGVSNMPIYVGYKCSGRSQWGITSVTPWTLSWNKHGRITELRCPPKRHLHFGYDERSQSFQMSLRWDSPRASVHFRLYAYDHSVWPLSAQNPTPIRLQYGEAKLDVSEVKRAMKITKEEAKISTFKVYAVVYVGMMFQSRSHATTGHHNPTTREMWTSKKWTVTVDAHGNIKSAKKND